MTRTRGEAASPGGALRVALVGPLVSLAAAGLFGVLAAAFDGLGAPGLVEGTAGWLARINVLLAGFNLMPAAPLDGGRVLQAVLWQRRGDRLAASVTAAQAGRAFGFLLVGIGVLDVSTGVGVGGLWFALLGWFLVAAAGTEQVGAEARGQLRGVRVGDVMTRDPVVVPGWITVDAFLADYALRHRVSAFVVQTFDGGLAGLVTLDALKQVPPHRRGAVRLVDIAVPRDQVPTARPDEMVLDLLERMVRDGAERAFVLEDRPVVGMLSPGDIARAMEIASAFGSGGPPGAHSPLTASTQ